MTAKTSRVKVTPDMAREWLKHNVKNRRLRAGHVKHIAGQIAQGNWCDDHHIGIAFNQRGELIDGQHRLHAVMLAGIPVQMLVTHGVSDAVRMHTDTGVARTLEDLVDFTDESESLNRYIARVITNYINIPASITKKPTAEESLVIWESHREAIEFAARWLLTKQQLVCRAFVAVALLEYHLRDADKANEFASELLRPDSMCNQTRVLRDLLLRHGSASGGSFTRAMYRRCVTAMRAHLENRKISIIREGGWE